MVNTPGEIIITLESEERHYPYETLGVGYESTDNEIVGAVSPMLSEDVGIEIDDEFRSGNWTVKRVESSQNIYIFPKSTAGGEDVTVGP